MNRRRNPEPGSIPPVIEAALIVALFLACMVGSAI